MRASGLGELSDTLVSRDANVEFFADRLGGGSEDVLIKSLSDTEYNTVVYKDIVYPNADGEYEFSVDNDATISLPYEVYSASEVANNGKLVPVQLEGNVVSKGKWKIKPNMNVRLHNLEAEDVELGEAYVHYDEDSLGLSIAKDDIITPSGSKVVVKVGLVESGSKKVPASAYKNVAITVVEHVDGTKQTSNTKLRDNGLASHGDVSKNDGIFSGTVSLSKPGNHALEINLEANVNGEDIRRSTVVRSVVSPVRLKVAKNRIDATLGVIEDTPLEGKRYGLSLGVNVVKGSVPEIVDTNAQVWGNDSNGDDVVVGWIGGLVEPTLLVSLASCF